MAGLRCIVVWPAHLASLTRAQQYRRPKRLMAGSSFAHRETASLLQAAHSDYQIGAFENFHQPVEDALIVLRPGPKVLFQYELCFVNCLKCQLLISHLFLPIKQMPPGKGKIRNQGAFGKYPPLSRTQLINFYFTGQPAAHDRGGKLALWLPVPKSEVVPFRTWA
jgi:hypothetical protein